MEEKTDKLEEAAAAAVHHDIDAGYRWLCQRALERGSVPSQLTLKVWSTDDSSVEGASISETKDPMGSGAGMVPAN